MRSASTRLGAASSNPIAWASLNTVVVDIVAGYIAERGIPEFGPIEFGPFPI